MSRGEPEEPEIKREEADLDVKEEKKEPTVATVKVELGAMSTRDMVRLDSTGRRRIYEAPNAVTMNNASDCQLIRMELPPIKVRHVISVNCLFKNYMNRRSEKKSLTKVTGRRVSSTTKTQTNHINQHGKQR